MEKSIFNRMLFLTFGFLTLGGCLVPAYGNARTRPMQRREFSALKSQNTYRKMFRKDVINLKVTKAKGKKNMYKFIFSPGSGCDKNGYAELASELKILFKDQPLCHNVDSLYSQIANRMLVNRKVTHVSGKKDGVERELRAFEENSQENGNYELKNIPGGLKVLSAPGNHGKHAAVYREEENPTTGKSEIAFIYGNKRSMSTSVPLRVLGAFSDGAQKRIFDYALLKAKERKEVGFPKGLKRNNAPASVDAGDR